MLRCIIQRIARCSTEFGVTGCNVCIHNIDQTSNPNSKL